MTVSSDPITIGKTPITPEHGWWCLAGLGSALAPHAMRFAPPMWICFIALALWRMLGAYGVLPLPIRTHRLLWWLKQGLALATFGGIYLTHHGQIGRDAGVSLLSTLVGLKFLELERTRDFYVLTFLAYFLVLTNFFYAQSVPSAFYLLAVVTVITGGLIRFNTPRDQVTTGACLRLAARMMLQATPVMVTAFLLFPRIPGPLWGLPQDAFTHTTGLSDHMTLGEITRLGLSDEIAFQVEFDGAPPRAADRYWRGPVLWDTDGRSWHTHDFGSRVPNHPVRRLGVTYRYALLLEPTNERWLLGLDTVTDVGDNGHLGPDQTLWAPQPVKKQIRYALGSTLAVALNELSDAEYAAALALPPHAHPKTRALAESWQRSGGDPAASVTGALDFLRDNGFVYTLLPPAPIGDPIDDFLFRSRAGFCEHFAASFVVLMRSAGVPARVVTGYQGGDFNEISGHFVIRQRDAHAWAEVYLPRQGWTRVDPTSVVAPGRLSLGINAIADPRTALPMIEHNADALRAWREATDLWDAVNYQWSRWVLGYSGQRQLALIQHLGFQTANLQVLALSLLLSVCGIVGLMGIATLRSRAPTDPLVRHYALFCRKLARIGLPRAPQEGALAYAQRIIAIRPDLMDPVNYITRLYATLRYGNTRIAADLLESAVKRFRPRRVPPRLNRA